MLHRYRSIILALAFAFSLTAHNTGAHGMSKKPDASEAAAETTNPFNKIHIVNATFGANCDGQGIHNRLGVPGFNKKYEIEHGNARKILQERCDGKITCNLTASSEFLGFDPAENCPKTLKATYRCFNIDNPHTITIEHERNSAINCETPLAPPATP